ncbi:pyridoxamine 5'-phosphate oxidase family protein [Falsiroseomonas sp.]|uniref:pyridoxamine 5'-phosphate oxidase family protein n=1 Tax=Falsiroseomonas sp. TaxID=2870721 RepID=UPI003563E2E3
MILGATLEDCLAEAFRRLARGVADRRSPFHTPTLATIGADGAPEARTLVLRGFEPASRQLRLHSDARSGKVAALARDPRCQLHLYDAAAKLQLRLSGRAALHDDALADAAWRDSRQSSRMCYAVEPGPGTPVAAPPPAPRDAEAGRGWFRVILLRFDRLEWLELAAAGHRRARFDWPAEAPLAATWLVP